MQAHMSNNKTYKDLQVLLRLFIGGIFILVGLNYVFGDLIENLDKETNNLKLEVTIEKNIEQETIQAQYHLAQAISQKNFENFKIQTKKTILHIENVESNIKILKFGGVVQIDEHKTSNIYDPFKNNLINKKLQTSHISGEINKLIENLSKSMKKKELSLKDKDINSLIKEEQKIINNMKKIDYILEQQLSTISILQEQTLQNINIREKEIETKQQFYFYAQIAALIFVVLSLLYTSKPIRDQIIKTHRDLENTTFKAQKFASASMQASKAKSEFLANMSHEIRTPLNAILGFIDILKESEKDKEKISYLQTIHNSSQTLLGIINDILDFSKIESGNLNIEKINFNVVDEFQTLADLFRAKASEKSLEFILSMDQNMPAALYSDPLRIKQVIANLLSNAIKFTPINGKIELKMNYRNGELNIAVLDSGIGIDKDKQNHIFEAFSQAESSTTRKYGGTGLGLSISAKLVEMLGGKLKIKSELNNGSIFYFSLPTKVGKYKSKHIKTTKSKVDFKGKKILLVEDNKANQMFMSLILKKFSLKHEIANDGNEAVKLFKNNRYDLILMDENMPNLNGIEATKQILEIEKEQHLEHTPIIALTANALKGDREKFMEAGMDEYLSKPINKDKLAMTIKIFLDPNYKKQKEYA